MLRHLLPLLLVLACDPVHPVAAQASAERWARELGLKADGVTCHHCANVGCECEVRVGQQIFALYCGRNTGCSARVPR